MESRVRMNNQIRSYIETIRATAGALKPAEIESGVNLLIDAWRHRRSVYICGNGGSASTASHLAVDLGKNVQTPANQPLRVMSLTDNTPWLTALANDDGYENCFAQQLHNYILPGDLVIGISASGHSENVVRAVQLAQARNADSLALVGFDGGRLATLSTRNIWVRSDDYGVVESIHLTIAHMLVNLLSDAIRHIRRTDDHHDNTDTYHDNSGLNRVRPTVPASCRSALVAASLDVAKSTTKTRPPPSASLPDDTELAHHGAQSSGTR
jgi:D-sedoheptulose 7-phosphate isomerase